MLAQGNLRRPSTLNLLSNIVVTLFEARELDSAVPLGEQVWQARKEILGDDHPDTLVSMSNLAMLYLRQGK